MEIRFSDYAEKKMNRFKYLNEYDVEDYVRDKVEEDSFQDFLEECYGAVNNEFYYEDYDVTIYSTVKSNIVTIDDVRRGKPDFID